MKSTVCLSHDVDFLFFEAAEPTVEEDNTIILTFPPITTKCEVRDDEPAAHPRLPPLISSESTDIFNPNINVHVLDWKLLTDV